MKIKTNDSHACGKRIKTARLLAGLSRKDMEEKFSISASTLQAWEIGKNPLNEKSANKLIEIFNSMMLICSSEWLLYGIGTPPRTLAELQKISNIDVSNETVNWSDEIAIQKEIDYFCTINKSSIVILINDDGMEPIYALGDYVGGKKHFSNQINSTVGMNCIVQLTDQSIYVRKVMKCLTNGLFNLFCNNPNSHVIDPVLSGVDLVFSAPIIWHRKNDPLII